MKDTIYNKGEQTIQEKFGETKMANRVQRGVKDLIVPGAVAFIKNQPMVILSSKDAEGSIWVSILINDFGFAKVPAPKKILFDLENIRSSRKDIIYSNIQTQSNVGSIFIELGSRRRFRVNGTALLKENRISLEIEEAYPNCPKYIQRRVLNVPKENNSIIPDINMGTALSMTQQHWIINSDTLFVGSQSAEGKMDASHRGGNYGFIEVLKNGDLKIPDYVGNSMYNTLGNFVENPNAGLLFIDFKMNRTLQLSGKASLLFDQESEEDAHKTTNTGRYWIFKVEKWIQTNNHSNATWSYEDASPFNPDLTGS